MFHVNDPKEIHASHNGLRDARKPDIGAITIESAKLAKGRRKKLIQESATAKPHNRFIWAEILSPFEFKLGQHKSLNFLPDRKYTTALVEDRFKTVRDILAVSLRTAALLPETSKPKKRAIPNDASRITLAGTAEGRNALRDFNRQAQSNTNLQRPGDATPSGSTHDIKRAKTSANLQDEDEESENFPDKPPLLQNAAYAAEMLSRGAYTTHVITVIIYDEIAWLWWFDRQGAIQSTGIDMVTDLPYFAVLLAAFQRFDLEDWGIIEELHPGAAKEQKSGNKSYWLQQIDFIPDSFRDGDQSPTTGPCSKTFIIETGTDKGNWGLVGRGTCIMSGIAGGADDVPHANKAVVFKFSWPEVKRTSEAQIIWKASQLDSPFTRDHLPKLVASRRYGYSTSKIREALGIKPREDSLHREPRELRLLISYPLTWNSDIHEKPEHFMGFWVDWYQCMSFSKMISLSSLMLMNVDPLLGHRILWINEIEHRDISPSNLMVDATDQKYPKGVLNDFDLAVYQPTHVQPGGERTGTIPYMALDLLNRGYFSGHVERLYRHDLESFIWVLVVATLRTATDTSGQIYDIGVWINSSQISHVHSNKLELQSGSQHLPETLAGTNQYQWRLCKSLLQWLAMSQAFREFNKWNRPGPVEDSDDKVLEDFEKIVAENWPKAEETNWPKFEAMGDAGKARKVLAAEGK
ncbi:hypothetical protein H0H81_003919 [Sphagnurus paluster]|uniref:Protein kinase domain-containing protein n=1 Tax=Sphagnurus paluster TaxID=117069 RepID=A0A9P7FPS9_9AGAR|nr:hypothetical protein H0H81_003919 [Sphagnurus paluster]